MTEYKPTDLGPERNCRFYENGGKLGVGIHPDKRFRLAAIVLKTAGGGRTDIYANPDALEAHARDCQMVARWLRENR